MGIMVRTCRPALFLIPAVVFSLVLLAPAPAAAQEPVKAFDLLNTRLKVGDTVWVTDASGREVKGKLTELTATSLTLNGGDRRTFKGPDVRTILERPHDSLKFGTLLGLVIGVGLGAFSAGTAEGNASEVLGAIAILGGMGAGIGCGIDAMIPMPKRPVYLHQAGSSSTGPASWSPIVRPRSAGAAVAFTF
jgi:hypothetical protein